jgi:hypothetical protein
MSFLVYVAGFGFAVAFFLWLRDLRIFYRTGLPGYRIAAYRGVIYTAVALFGFLVTYLVPAWEFVGLGLVLLGLYLQGQVKRERVWRNESTAQRFLGETERTKDKDTQKRN